MSDILNIEILAPYFPYGLNCYVQGECVEGTEYDDPSTPKRFKIMGCDKSFIFVSDISKPSYEQVCFSDCIPILRPLSDIEDYFKSFWYKGDVETMKFLDYDYLEKFDDLHIEQLSYTKIEYIPYGTFKLLLQHHFDLFDLIGQDLAININTIK
jgi:hypothetical protein